MEKWRVDYVVGNTYKIKFVYAENSTEAIKKAKVKHIVDLNIAEKSEMNNLIMRKVPEQIKARTEENMSKYNLGLYDAFNEAVRNYPKLKKGSELWKAFYYDDFRLWIPSAYSLEYFDFEKYPLKYEV